VSSLHTMILNKLLKMMQTIFCICCILQTIRIIHLMLQIVVIVCKCSLCFSISQSTMWACPYLSHLSAFPLRPRHTQGLAFLSLPHFGTLPATLAPTLYRMRRPRTD
jgi:hypothetical protein